MSEWNDAVRAALAMIDRLGADRPRQARRRDDNAEGRYQNMNAAQHTRARSIRAGVETLLRPEAET